MDINGSTKPTKRRENSRAQIIFTVEISLCDDLNFKSYRLTTFDCENSHGKIAPIIVTTFRVKKLVKGENMRRGFLNSILVILTCAIYFEHSQSSQQSQSVDQVYRAAYRSLLVSLLAQAQPQQAHAASSRRQPCIITTTVEKRHPSTSECELPNVNFPCVLRLCTRMQYHSERNKAHRSI